MLSFILSVKMKNVSEAEGTTPCLGIITAQLVFVFVFVLSKYAHIYPKGGTDCGRREVTNAPLLTSEAGPLSAPGQEKVTNSWHRLCTTKQQTAKEKIRVGGRKGSGEG